MAQVRDSLQAEIENFKGVPNLIVPNARQVMVKALSAGDYQKMNAVMQYLESREDKLVYPSLRRAERLYIKYLAADYAWVLQEIDRLAAPVTASVTAPPANVILRDYHYNYYPYGTEDNLYNNLTDHMVLQFHTVRARIAEDERLGRQQADLLQLYLRFYLPATAGKAFSADSVYKEAKKFLKQYPNSPYKDFVRRKIIYPVEEAPVKIGLGLQGGYLNNSEALQSILRNTASFGAVMHVCYKELIFSVQVKVMSSNLPKDIPVNNVLWKSEFDYTYIMGDLNMGYLLVNNKRLWLYPYVGAGLSNLAPSDKDAKDNPELKGLRISGAVYPTAGICIGLKAKKSLSSYSTAKGGDYFFHKTLNIGMAKQDYSRAVPGAKGTQFFASVILGHYISTKPNFRY
jgi:hypothetical protein